MQRYKIFHQPELAHSTDLLDITIKEKNYLGALWAENFVQALKEAARLWGFPKEELVAVGWPHDSSLEEKGGTKE